MKLTRKLVLARAKASDLESVKKLNCWGCNLTDISIFEQIPNVEVLTLSANHISSLEPISSCQHLSELYLRRNDIRSLCELRHLRGLGYLKVLWLAENPCCYTSDPSTYRLTVIRTLPGLHKLDNQLVTEEELAQALKEGEELVSPPGPAPTSSTNGLTEAESENDPLNYSMEETNKIRAQLGMKLLPRDKFPSLASPREAGDKRKCHTLEAVLLLLKDLDVEELKIVQSVTESKLRSRSRQRERSPVCS
ncbi:cilia- and flagella-associated protein 410-like [Pimephales promelas]|uniref:cilia- and flagella-associated protein 410-like n=1 Tax=Pimephales promelas TaxID=90988 RepID=UPI0019556754|nr:cilia- and flagella-associated protein 410-like [Pimephales promelas]KAG1941751.1 protein C21orf2 [Pimephales promelas]